jgi:hypothetical protein
MEANEMTTKNGAEEAKKNETVKATVIETPDGSFTVKRFLSRKNEDGSTSYKCQYCGKWISAESGEEFEAGSYCHQLRDINGWTDEMLYAAKKERSLKEVPEHFVKLAAVDRAVKKAGLSISAFRKTFGDDRGLQEPTHTKFRPIYVGNVRYLDEWCLTPEGLNEVRKNMKGAPKPVGEQGVEAPAKKGKAKPKTEVAQDLAEEVEEGKVWA